MARRRRAQAAQDPRFAIVDEHIERENAHDLDGILATFGDQARYDDEAWAEQHIGPAGVRGYYEALLTAMPDLKIEVLHRYASPEAVAYEVIISGTHLGPWRGVPATAKPLRFPLVAVYTFTDDDRLAGERIYYDRATVLRQLGLYHEPDTWAGRLSTALTHPWTIAAAITGKVWPWR